MAAEVFVVWLYGRPGVGKGANEARLVVRGSPKRWASKDFEPPEDAREVLDVRQKPPRMAAFLVKERAGW